MRDGSRKGSARALHEQAHAAIFDTQPRQAGLYRRGDGRQAAHAGKRAAEDPQGVGALDFVKSLLRMNARREFVSEQARAGDTTLEPGEKVQLVLSRASRHDGQT